jgi:NAD(P)-dependent dehydrogenase (short-subunit alcohol dehydrogenase family)
MKKEKKQNHRRRREEEHHKDDDVERKEEEEKNYWFEEKLNKIRGFSEEELNACVKVLQNVTPAKNTKAYDEKTLEEEKEEEEGERKREGTESVFAAAAEKKSSLTSSSSSSFKTVLELKRHKRLRTSLLPLVEYFTAKLYRGQDPAEYREQKQSKRAKNDRNQRMRAMDREAVAKTKLREERLRKLRRLEETNFNAASEAELLEWKRETDAGKRVLGNGTEDGGACAEEEEKKEKKEVEETTNEDEREGKQKQLKSSVWLVPDGVVEEEDGENMDDEKRAIAQNTLHNPNACYCCKKRFTEVHHFYASMCPSCAEENYFRRHFTCDMRGRYCIVTGARVKIGFRVALKLLKAGAFVVATTRFPEDARERFKRTDEELLRKQKQKESSFMSRLKIVAMDLRDLPALEKLCEKLNKELPRLDVIVNNACQTVRRPPTYYKHLLKGELVKKKERREKRRRIGNGGGEGENDNLILTTTTDDTNTNNNNNNDDDDDEWTVPTSVLQSQLEVLEKDKEYAAADETSAMITTTAKTKTNAVFPENVFDVNGQQVDLRTQNSWTMKLGEIETPELLEVLAVNAAAPFVLNGKLRALMKRTAMELPVPSKTTKTTKTMQEDEKRCAFIVNVSAMEGKFYRYKTANHPHTNMAKAALNMMTATCAKDYKKDFIYMTCVDTGWINDENPLPVASRIAKEHNFQTPIDEEDAAARVVGPIFESVAEEEEEEKEKEEKEKEEQNRGRAKSSSPFFVGRRGGGERREGRKRVWPPKSGVFLKDFKESEW